MRNSTLVIIVIIAALFEIFCTTSKGHFLLINKTMEPIARVSVKISGQTVELRDILPSKSAEGSYDVKSDSHFIIEVEFQSGKKLRKETGYVTNGMDFQHEIEVTGSDIDVTDSMGSIKNPKGG